MRTTWRQFIGLPHKTGADPRRDDAADCLLVAFAVLDELGLPHPPVDRRWFAMAKTGRWNELAEIFRSQSSISDPVDGAISMTDAGVIVAIDGGALVAQHNRGVRWVPIGLLGPREWRRIA